MSEQPRFFDDLAGLAVGAVSAVTGLRDEIESLVRARTDDVIRKLNIVTHEEFDVLAAAYANVVSDRDAADAKLADMAHRLSTLEARLAALEAAPLVEN
jgi:BMFP domain-containing protein YqiC